MLLSSNEWKSTLSLSIWRNGVISQPSPFMASRNSIRRRRRPHHRRCGEVAFRVTLAGPRLASRLAFQPLDLISLCRLSFFFSWLRVCLCHNYLQIAALPLTR